MKDLLGEYFKVKDMIVWKKDIWGVGYYSRPAHELAWLCHAGEPPLPKKAESNIWEEPGIPRRGYKRLHPSEKPLALMERSVRLCCAGRQKAVILDPCAGSGTTGIAALKAGHAFIGIEADKWHFEVMCKRISDKTIV
ncbi:MAG TPA: site-specific DNA-methyltransferase [Dissulfurispiraceae bacterium]|nr:site-specific DNA-methyltransferase [Dissulfurispiraceae bacterium]